MPSRLTSTAPGGQPQGVSLKEIVALRTGTAIGASGMSHYFSKKRVDPLPRMKLGNKKRRFHSPV